MATRIEFLRDGFPWNHAPGLLLGVDFPRESRRVHIERYTGTAMSSSSTKDSGRARRSAVSAPAHAESAVQRFRVGVRPR